MVGGWDVCPDVNEGDRKGRPYAVGCDRTTARVAPYAGDDTIKPSDTQLAG